MANKYSKRHTKQNALGNETEQASLALTVEVRTKQSLKFSSESFSVRLFEGSITPKCLCMFVLLSVHQKHQRQGQVEVISGSAWQGFRRKVCLLVPYMWPRGSVALQALVILCVGLLALERVINVFVPIYSRNIGETMHLEFFQSL